jgi:hypothetical protein
VGSAASSRAGAYARRVQGRENCRRAGAASRANDNGGKGDIGETVVLTGQILAENEVSLSFRIGGRILTRSANVGDRVVPDEVLATLDPVDEQDALRPATAALSAAEGQMVEASNNFDRQSHLMDRGFTTRSCSIRRDRICKPLRPGPMVPGRNLIKPKTGLALPS